MKNVRTTAVLAMGIALIYVAGGCAALRGGPSDEELLGELLTNYKAALDQGDADKLISLYSKNYQTSRGGSYDQMVSRLREFLPRLKEYEVEVLVADANIVIDGNTAKLGPITFESAMGSRDMVLVATKEDDGVWRITGREQAD
jgi:uncharacterized protein (DUF2164 family)